MLQRIGLAQALLNRPGLVILDEPTSGLDPVGRRLVRDIIRDLSEGGTTVFLNSHFLSEIEVTCDRVAFIKKGEVIRISTLNNLMGGYMTVELRARNMNPEIIQELTEWCQDIREDGERFTFSVPDESNIPVINRYLVNQNVEVFSLSSQHISLEDLFIQIVGTEGEL